ncbi:hypothetical protein HDU67_001417 [Dinochytrium kinnereticum]|nr:hypothetical protein HDU67_001417 [Dinochytrium kinnereticum]
MPPTPTKTIPVTVFTGFLGSGKTTIILSLLQQLPESYRVVFLKNEFGNVKVDSRLATKENVKVTEIMNGCLCCILVGQIKNALLEIKAPIAWQIRQIEDEGFYLDGIITVVDCENFKGYEDTSYTAKLQAKYTDLILMNKHELVDLSPSLPPPPRSRGVVVAISCTPGARVWLVSPDKYDRVMDSVCDLNEDTPKVNCGPGGTISKDLLFGIDSKFHEIMGEASAGSDELRHHHREVDLLHVTKKTALNLTLEDFKTFLTGFSGETVYRIKGFARLVKGDGEGGETFIVNWAFGRVTLTPTAEIEGGGDLEIVVMGRELSSVVGLFVRGLALVDDEWTLTVAEGGSDSGGHDH